MEFQGTILLHTSLSEAEMGETGFVSKETFRIFEKKMYVDSFAPYVQQAIAEICIPFEKIGEGKEDFKFFFDNIGISFPNMAEDPKKQEGWLGPFKVQFEPFSWKEFYKRTPLLELFNIWKSQVCDLNAYQDIQRIRRDKFNAHFSQASFSEINKEWVFITEELEAWTRDRDMCMADGEWDNKCEQSYTIMKKELQENKKYLKACLLSLDPSNMKEQELIPFIDWMYKNEPENFELHDKLQNALLITK
ncbi:MAG: hypothetical protein LBI53_06540 [Candidatus Peribacteria bacterium]|jgi:hypothetical protein|nr:hypothetical protein [Candidatus Peribacteria bacterium]